METIYCWEQTKIMHDKRMMLVSDPVDDLPKRRSDWLDLQCACRRYVKQNITERSEIGDYIYCPECGVGAYIVKSAF